MAPAKYAEIAKACVDVVSQEHGLALQSVCLLRTKSVPKTTSGKIARAWCRRGFVEGTLNIAHRWDGDGSISTPTPDDSDDAFGKW